VTLATDHGAARSRRHGHAGIDGCTGQRGGQSDTGDDDQPDVAHDMVDGRIARSRRHWHGYCPDSATTSTGTPAGRRSARPDGS
jgi:hypothetical protein